MDDQGTIGAEELERIVEQLAAAIPRSGRIAVADGAGFPHEVWPAIVELALRRPDIHVIIGWCLTAPARIGELSASQVRTTVSGFALRGAIDEGHVGFLPVRFGNMPALIAGALRPDALVTTVRPVGGGFAFSTEVGWQPAAIANGAAVFAVVRNRAPQTDAGEPLPSQSVTVLVESDRESDALPTASPTDDHREIGARIAALVPDGSRIQVGPGGLGVAVFEALERPVAIDSGIISDSVVGLADRGLLDGLPIAPYVVGTERVYDWCAGRVQVRRTEVTLDPTRLSRGRPMVAINTGIEIDVAGQVNAEAARGSAIGGIGGQPDYAAAAAASVSGVSIMAMSTRTAKGVPTLVRALQMPVTTPSHDVDVVVTELGSVDLRGLTRPERTAALIRLWGGLSE